MGEVDRAGDLRRHPAVTARQHEDIFAATGAGDVEAADPAAVAHHELTISRLRTVLFDAPSGITSMTDLSLDDWDAV